MSVKVQTLSALFALLMLVSGCDPSTQVGGGGIGGSGTGPGGGTVAEGGIGGSGSGTTTGYGSIYINDQRHYQIAENALIYLDGVQLHANTINPTGKGLPLGLITEFLLDEDVNEDVTQGTIIAMEAHHQIIGAITSLEPLKVLHQRVHINADSQLNGINLADLALGDVVQVAGLRDRQGKLRATRLAIADEGASWQLIGRISDLNGSQFKLDEQSIKLLPSAQKDCSTPLSNNMKVLVRSPQQAGFSAGDSLNAVNYVRCLGDGLNGSIERLKQRLPASNEPLPTSLPATTAGFISELSLLSGGNLLEVKIDGQRVDVSSVLPLLLDTVASLSLGSHIEVDGVLDTTTGVLKAKRLILRDELKLFKIIAPVMQLADGTLTLLGQEILGLPQSDGSLFAGLTEGDTIELLGFIVDGLSSESLHYAFSAKKLTSPPAHISIRSVIKDVHSSTEDILIGAIPFSLNTVSSISLLGQNGILTPVTDLLDTLVCKILLPFLCPKKDQPPELDGMLGELKYSSWNNGQPSGGELTIVEPASSTP